MLVSRCFGLKSLLKKSINAVFLPTKILSNTSHDLSRLGNEVISKKIFDWVTDAERNTPYLSGDGRNAYGQRTDELVTSEGWRNLQEMGLREG